MTVTVAGITTVVLCYWIIDRLRKKMLCSSFFLTTRLSKTNMSKSADEMLLGAASNGAIEDVKLLLNEGADINTKSPSKGPPLFQATVNAHVDVVKLLLDTRVLTSRPRVNTKHTRGSHHYIWQVRVAS